jgi:ribonuclease HI
MCYTDGSRHKHEGREVTGAGYYIPAPQGQDQTRTIFPKGTGVSNTILRAELTGILVALHNGHTTIATDSANSLQLIRKAILHPMQLQTHLHRGLLLDIVRAIEAITAKTGGTVHLLKVKAHSGVIGNECADVIAKKAAQLGNMCDCGRQFQENPFADHVWVETKPDATEEAPQILSNAGQALKQYILQTSGLGASNTQSTYFKLWQIVAEAAAPGSLSQIFRDNKITFRQKRLALQYRNDNLYNQKHAFRWKRATNPNCLCCGSPDSATHMLQGPCTETHSAMVTNRHHGAVGLVAKAVLKGARGGNLRFADISAEVASRIGMDHKGLDRWPNLKTTLTGLEKTRSSRPDMVLVEECGRDRKISHVTLVEVKYCADTNWLTRIEQAREQHAALETLIRDSLTRHKRLRTGEWKATPTHAQVEVVVLLIGVTGTTYKEHTLDPLVKKLGLSNEQASRLLAKLTRHSLEHAIQLRKHRYHTLHTSHG